MSSTTWPILLDYSNAECRKSLRKLELEAYASVISAFRAQGEMNKEKKKMLQELSTVLSISLERHKAEIRRAVNDEHLNTIADRLSGPNTSMEWSIEGRRILPLMPRLIQQTAFTALANFAADAQAVKNSAMPYPCKTGIKNIGYLNHEEPERKHKRSPSMENGGRPGKIFAFGAYSLPVSCSDVSLCSTNETSVSPFSQHQSILPTVIDDNDDERNITRKSVQSYNSGYLQNPALTSLSSKPLNGGTLSAVNALPKHSVFSVTTSAPSISSHGKHLLSASKCHLAENNTISTCALSSYGTKSVDSVMTPLSSTSGNDEGVTSTAASSDSFTCIKEKVCHSSKLPSKPRVGTSLSDGNYLSSSFRQVQVSDQSALKTSPKSRAVCPRSATSNSSSCSSVLSHGQTASNGQLVNRVQPPVCVPRIPAAVGNTPKAASPVTLKQCCNSSPASTSVKSVIKSQCVKLSCNSKPVITSAGKSFASKSHSLPPTTSVSCTSNQQCMKEFPVSTKGNLSSQLCPQKMSTSQSNQGKLSSTITKAVHCRNEGGFTGSARIINFTQPVNARFARATFTSPSISHPNAFPNAGLRVAVSVGVNNTPILRASVPAKPNVIVVHKAQVWPQTPGATIVMTSSASLSRISNESFAETCCTSFRSSHEASIEKNTSKRLDKSAVVPFSPPCNALKDINTNSKSQKDLICSSESFPEPALEPECSNQSDIFVCPDYNASDSINEPNQKSGAQMNEMLCPPTEKNFKIHQPVSEISVSHSADPEQILDIQIPKTNESVEKDLDTFAT